MRLNKYLTSLTYQSLDKMKKSILTILAITPLMSFAQINSSYESESLGLGGLIGLLIGLGICLLIFLALRQVVLWYWKIETLIANQHEQTKALQSIYNLLDEDIRLRKEQSKAQSKQISNDN